MEPKKNRNKMEIKWNLENDWNWQQRTHKGYNTRILSKVTETEFNEKRRRICIKRDYNKTEKSELNEITQNRI